MKKTLIIGILLLTVSIGYTAAQIKMKFESEKNITQYVVSNIVRYDLGDVECFVENINHSMFCLRK